jgi:hypothetical protein
MVYGKMLILGKISYGKSSQSIYIWHSFFYNYYEDEHDNLQIEVEIYGKNHETSGNGWESFLSKELIINAKKSTHKCSFY